MNFRVNLIDNDEPEDINLRIKRLLKRLKLKAKLDLSASELYLFGVAPKVVVIGKFATQKSLYSHLEVLAEYEKIKEYLKG